MSRGRDGRRLRIHAADAGRAARGQHARSPGARGRASAGLELQPPPLRSSPHRRPARGYLAGAPSGDPWRPPAEWQLRGGREVRSPGGSSCLLQRWGMGRLRALRSLRKRRRPSHQGGAGERIRKDALWVRTQPRHLERGKPTFSKIF